MLCIVGMNIIQKYKSTKRSMVQASVEAQNCCPDRMFGRDFVCVDPKLNVFQTNIVNVLATAFKNNGIYY